MRSCLIASESVPSSPSSLLTSFGSHYALMMKYVSSMDNLKTIMNLLRHKSPHIQFE